MGGDGRARNYFILDGCAAGGTTPPMIAVALLIIGIIGFVKGRINVTNKRELRGGPMYAVATLFCIPLPLSFVLGLFIGVDATRSGKQLDTGALATADVASLAVPLVAAFVIAFVMARPKAPPVLPGQPVDSGPRGFEVKM
jgi:hypothetical protein